MDVYELFLQAIEQRTDKNYDNVFKKADELFSQAVEQHKIKNYDAVLKILDEIKTFALNYKYTYYLEAWTYSILNNSVKEYYALKKILLFMNFSSVKNREFASDILSYIADICGNIGLLTESIDCGLLAKKMNTNNQRKYEILQALIVHMNCLENCSPSELNPLYTELEKCLADVTPYPKKFYDHKKIHVGFLSADFFNHVIIVQSWSLLTKLDKTRFEVYFYSNVKKPDKTTEKLKKTSDGWRDIYDLTDEVAAKLIRDDEIDILFDLSGYTVGNRLRVAAYCPASVQVSGIGYMNSIGISCFDYFLSDVYCAGDETFFTEKLIKLPHSHFCYEPSMKRELANIPPYLKNNFVTFGCFNNFSKVTDSILNAWKKILDAVPQSHLLLKTKIFNTEDGKNFVRERLKSFGFDLDRIEMRPYSANHLADYADVDIALDTFPYTGGVTTCNALYMGVPVVSLYGSRHGTRFGLSILKNVGLDELAVDSYDEYIKRAIMSASDWELLTILRKNLRTMMKNSPIMDSENYLHEIQDAFTGILNEQKKLWRNADSERL